MFSTFDEQVCLKSIPSFSASPILHSATKKTADEMPKWLKKDRKLTDMKYNYAKVIKLFLSNIHNPYSSYNQD